MNRSILSCALVAVALTAACGGNPPAESKAAPAQSAPAAKTDAPAAPEAAASEFGVPECDRYLENYLACVESKVPDAARGMMKQQLEQSKSAWKQAAATPQGKAGLAMACTQAEAAAKQALAAYGCTW